MNDSKDVLGGKNILVVGSTGGIGRALVENLHKKGAKLFLVARNQEQLEKLAQHSGSEFYACDVVNPISVKELFLKIGEKMGNLNGIVNLAGSVLLKPAHMTSSAEWESVIAQNLTSAFNCIKFGIPVLAEASSVVLLSSAAARIGLENHEAIAAAKAGLIGLTISAAATYAYKGIRFNCVAPGLVKTGLTEKIRSNPASENASLSLHPLKRLGEPQDIAPLIEFLLSENSSWITGQTIGADGGLGDLKTLRK